MGAKLTAAGKRAHLEMDHMIPRSKSGTDHAGSFHLLCGTCNNLKRHRSHEHLIAELAKHPRCSGTEYWELHE